MFEDSIVKRAMASTKPFFLFEKTLNSVESWLTDGCKAEDFAHIEDATKEELSGKVAEASKWLDERQTMSANAPKTQDPPFFAREVSDKAVPKSLNELYFI